MGFMDFMSGIGRALDPTKNGFGAKFNEITNNVTKGIGSGFTSAKGILGSGIDTIGRKGNELIDTIGKVGAWAGNTVAGFDNRLLDSATGLGNKALDIPGTLSSNLAMPIAIVGGLGIVAYLVLNSGSKRLKLG